MEADRAESERCVLSGKANEGETTLSGDQQHTEGHSLALLRSGGVDGSANRMVRQSSILQMQETHGNHAVQRAVHARTALRQNTLPVQRSPLTGTSDMEEELLLSEGGVCLPEGEESMSWGTDESEMFGNMFGGSAVGGTTHAEPEASPNEDKAFATQKKMQELKRMYEMLSNVSKTRSEISMTFARNMRG